MSNLFPVPDDLARAEYALLIFQMEASEYFDLPPLGLLRLRREFRQGIQLLNDSGESRLAERCRQLLEPAPPDDPKWRKLVQRPAPPLVLRPRLEQSGLVEPGDWVELPVLFLGSGIAAIEAFARLLQQVGRQGLLNGRGRCELATVEVEDASGKRTTIWNGGPLGNALIPVVNDLGWWVARQSTGWESLHLDFLAPARLVHDGRPLFRAGFGDLFPFVLRRVSSMLAAHCQLDIVPDPALLLDASKQIEEVENRLLWRDWKTLATGPGSQNLGGLCGSVSLSGAALADLLWVLQLGSLLQIGKGAPYGAGRYQLC